jgi:hypothetical protein
LLGWGIGGDEDDPLDVDQEAGEFPTDATATFAGENKRGVK